ncbi:retrovirus-related pol polyprotein from transposon TNT 1-94 [Tanacetum coccineum]
MQQPQPNNNFVPQPSFNTNYLQQPVPNPEDISDPTTAMNMALVLMAKEIKLNYSTPTNNNQRISSNPHNSKHRHRVLRLTKLPSMIQTDQLSMEHSGGTVEQHPAIVEETHAYFESLYNNLVTEVEKTNTVNRKMKEIMAGESLDKIMVLEKENELLLRTVLQAQFGDLKSKSMNTHYASNTLDPLSQILDDENKSVVRQPNAFQSDRLKSSKARFPPKVVDTIDFSKPVPSNSVLNTQESKVVKNDKVIDLRMCRINPFKTYRDDKFVSINQARASGRIKPITVSQPHVITKKDVNSDSTSLSSTRVDNTAKTRMLQHRSNTKNDRVPSASKSSCIKNNEVEVEEHHRNLLLSKYQKHMSSECNNVKLAIRNDKSEVKHKAKVKKSKKLGSKERLASPKPRNPRTCLRWSPTGRIFDFSGKLIESSDSEYQSDCSNGDNACASNPQEPTSKWSPNSTSFLDRLSKFVYGASTRGNILIERVYYVEGVGDNLFSVRQFCDLDLEVAFRRNTYFVRNLERVNLLNENHTTNLYTINLHEMASASPICLMARATSTKSWLWHQRLSHLNFDIINDLAKNDLVFGLPKFKYSKENLCPSCEQGKSKTSPHKPKLVPNSKQRLHLLHMDLCGPMRVESINGKRYVLVIVDDYSRYTWVHFLRSKDEAPELIKTFLKKIQVLLQAPAIIIRTDNGTKFTNQVLKVYFNSVGISHRTSSVRTPQQNRVVERRN